MDLIKTFNLKVDPDLPIHYLIGIAVHSHPRSKKRGQLFLKYGPIVFNNTDVENLKFAIETHKGELIKTTLEDALKIFDVSALVSEIGMFKISCQVNVCTMHHFSSSQAFDGDYFDHMIELANKDKTMNQFLMDAEVRR
jgi:hypothetical protein